MRTRKAFGSPSPTSNSPTVDRQYDIFIDRISHRRRNPVTKATLYCYAAADLILLDVEECARRMSTTVFAIRELIRSGKLKFLMIGQKHLVSPAAIQEFIAANEAYYKKESGADPGP
jgi:excisionase family DNA binding protein